MKLLAFDLEISRPFIEGEWRNKDLGISCVGFASLTNDKRNAWTITDDAARHGNHAMKPEGLDLVLWTLARHQKDGYKILSWNGLGFDFPMLLEYVEQKELCKKVALAHYDLAFQMFCAKGFMIGLDTAAKGMGLSGKLEGMKGEWAPLLWSGTDDWQLEDQFMDVLGVANAGSIEAQEIVLKYVQQDAVTTLEVIEKVMRHRALSWESRSGRRCRWHLPIGGGIWSMRTVAECLALPEPDTSWMSEPRSRSDYAGWLG